MAVLALSTLLTLLGPLSPPLSAQRPEYEFQCEAPVLCVAFHPHNPRVVLGGTATGEIALWRLGDGPHPSQRTPLRLESHVMPICRWVGSTACDRHSALFDTRVRVSSLSLTA